MPCLGNVSCGQAMSNGWGPPCNTSLPGTKGCRAKFSAVCWLFGKDLAANLVPKRPLGLIESSFGGTADEDWSSPDALVKCGTRKSSVLWYGMIYPLLRTTIKVSGKAAAASYCEHHYCWLC